MAIYFLVHNQTVVNAIALENIKNYSVPEGHVLVERTQDVGWIGSYWLGGSEFVDPKPYPSWTWEGTKWDSPVPYPQDNKEYIWNEEVLNWDEIIPPPPSPDAPVFGGDETGKIA